MKIAKRLPLFAALASLAYGAVALWPETVMSLFNDQAHATEAGDKAICFDSAEIWESANRQGLQLRGAGSLTDPVDGPVVVLIRTPDGARWSLWKFYEGRGCFMGNGARWIDLDARGLAEPNE